MRPTLSTLTIAAILAFSTGFARPASAQENHPTVEFRVTTSGQGSKLNLRAPPTANGAPGKIIGKLARGQRVALNWDAFITSLASANIAAKDREALLSSQDCRLLGATWRNIFERGRVGGREFRFVPVIATDAKGASTPGYVAVNYLSSKDLEWSCRDFRTELMKRSATALDPAGGACLVQCLLSKESPSVLSREMAAILARLLGPKDDAQKAVRDLAENADSLCSGPDRAPKQPPAQPPEQPPQPPKVPPVQLPAQPPKLQPAQPEPPRPEAPAQESPYLEARVQAFRTELPGEHGFPGGYNPGLSVTGVRAYSPTANVMRPNLADGSCPRGFDDHASMFEWFKTNKDSEAFPRCLSYQVDLGEHIKGILGEGQTPQNPVLRSFSLQAGYDRYLEASGTTTAREFRFLAPETARNTALQVIDQGFKGTSSNISKVFLLFPRKNRPAIAQRDDGSLEVTLTTGEKVRFDAVTKRVIPSKGGVLVERDWVDLNSNRFARRVPVEYRGSGIAVTVSSRTFRSPVDGTTSGPLYAEISKPVGNGARVSCRVDARKLWYQAGNPRSGEFKFGTDAEFYAFLKTVKQDDATGSPCRLP